MQNNDTKNRTHYLDPMTSMSIKINNDEPFLMGKKKL